MLGRPGSPLAIDRGLVLACSEEDVGAPLDEVDALLRDLVDTRAPLVVHAPLGVPVELYLDGPKTTTWTAFARVASGELVLHVSEKLDVGRAVR